MQLPILLILSFVAGSLIKLADDIADRNPARSVSAIPFGLGYGLIMGYLMLMDTDASIVFGGIVLGCLVTGKIDSACHYFGLGAILAIIFLYGVKIPVLILPVAVFAALDELKGVIRFPALNFVFDYRLFLKLGVLVLVMLKILDLNALLILIVFDSAYALTGRFS